MLCCICGKNPATIHIQEIIGSEKKVLHLCQECAEKKAREDSTFKEFNLAEVLFQLSSQIGNQLHKEEKSQEPAPKQEIIYCKSCGWDSESFRKTGLMGCPDCCAAFHEILDPALEAIHRGPTHTGKRPAKVTRRKSRSRKPSVALIRMNIKRLQAELESAVAAERYEDAANFRDKITALQAELDGLTHGK